MDSVQVTGHEDIGNNVISLGLSPGKCSPMPDSLSNNVKPHGNINSNLPLAEDLGNLSFHEDSVNLSVNNKKHAAFVPSSANGLVYEINNVPDDKHRSNLNHQMEKSLVDKSSQYQSCSNETKDVAVAYAVSNSNENLKELKTSSSKEAPSDCSTNCSSSEMKQLSDDDDSDIRYVLYESELQMPDIMRLIQKDLSEPYSIYTYRYFIHNWPNLCFLAMHKSECVGAIVCKLDMHRKVVKRGYIAMLAVDEKYRKRKIGSNLVLKAIKAMVADKADEVVLETEITNQSALRLYENLGFVRDKRLFRYYLNGVDALRLKLWLR